MQVSTCISYLSYKTPLAQDLIVFDIEEVSIVVRRNVQLAYLYNSTEKVSSKSVLCDLPGIALTTFSRAQSSTATPWLLDSSRNLQSSLSSVAKFSPITTIFVEQRLYLSLSMLNMRSRLRLSRIPGASEHSVPQLLWFTAFRRDMPD